MAPGLNVLKRFRSHSKRLEELREILDDVLKRLDRLEEHPLSKRRHNSVCELCFHNYQSPGCLAITCSIRNYLESKEKEDV